MNDFELAAKEYLSILEKLLVSEGHQLESTAELSYRPALNSFFENLTHLINHEIESIFEPRKQKGGGRPDWRFHNKKNLGIYGYIESKGLDLKRKLEPSNYKNQIQRYLFLDQKLILTDGIDFIFYTDDNIFLESLVIKPVKPIKMSKLYINPNIEVLFRKFFNDVAPRECSEDELINGLAKRCRQLSNGVQEIIDIPIGTGFSDEENQTILTLNKLFDILKIHHDSRLNSREAFGNFIAQVLTFGLLLAHRYVLSNTDDPLLIKEKLEKFWFDDYFNKFTNDLTPFKALSKLLKTELSHLGNLGTWHQDTVFYLAHIKLKKNQIEHPDYHILFEKFLTEFDPKTRFDFGAFYTPMDLANFSVKFSELLSWTYFSCSLYNQKNKFIDPCCGTGTFLESLIINKSTRNKIPKIIGFEILPGPYALAKYRLGVLGFSGDDEIKIFLTNTLSDEVNSKEFNEHEDENDPFLLERNKVRKISSPPITLVIGNPPSSDSKKSSETNDKIIVSLLEDFRPPKNERSSRQNIQKNIANSFMKFLRWSVDKVTRSGRGIVSLVVPSTFLTNKSYFWAREYLVNGFYAIYVLDIDEDLRAGDGDNLFNVQQGRSLISCVYGAKHGNPGVYYNTISNLRKEEKINFLKTKFSNNLINAFTFIKPGKLLLFSQNRRSLTGINDKYLIKLYPLDQDERRVLFLRHCNGLKLSPTAFFVHQKKEILIRRLSAFRNLPLNKLDEMILNWFSGQKKPPQKEKLTQEVLNVIPHNKEIESKLKEYSFRPFLKSFAFIDLKLMSILSKLAGGGARIRPEIISVYGKTGACSIAIAPSPAELGKQLKSFASFCFGIPDNDLCARGNARILSPMFPDYKKKGVWNSTPKININLEIMAQMASQYTKMKELTENQALNTTTYYVYALLRSNKYLEIFGDSLFNTAGVYVPEIFFPIISDDFFSIANLGESLAKLEKPEHRKGLPEHGTLNKKIDNDTFKFTKHKISVIDARIDLFENKNLMASINDIPKEILLFSIAGYKVIDTWLKFNNNSYSRSVFSSNELKELRQLIAAIEKSINIISEIDVKIKKIIKNELMEIRNQAT